MSTTDDEAGADVAPASLPPFDLQRRHCGRPWCRCTHDNGCEFGWIEYPEGVAPCSNCQPTKAQLPNESREQWLHRLRHPPKKGRP